MSLSRDSKAPLKTTLGEIDLIPISYNLRSLSNRRAGVLMTASTVALVTMLLLLLSGFVAGAIHTMTVSADANNWVVLLRSVNGEEGTIPRQWFEVVSALPQIATGSEGQPLISPETALGFDPTPDSSVASIAVVRGVTPMAYAVHRDFRLVSGRLPVRGQGEVIVGQRLAVLFPGLRHGAVFRFGQHTWKVVGTFSDGGSSRESEAWIDYNDLLIEARVNGGDAGFNSFHVILRPGYQQQFSQALEGDPRLRLHAMSERDFYALQAGFAKVVEGLGMLIALLLALGALFGGMNTMYSAVATRAREVGVLRALGFSRAAVRVSFIIESVFVGLFGGILGVLLGLCVAHVAGLTSRLMHVGTLLFSFWLTPAAFATGISAGIAIGFFGGVLPAWRASRIDIVSALRG